MKRRFVSDSAAQTQRLGARLAQRLAPGDVVLFLADLGAGKTTFVQGMARALGAADVALSPTFIIAETIQARIPIHHLDFYRLNEVEILGMGVQDYLTGSGEIAPGLVLIEWAERFPKIWPPDRLEVRITIDKKSERRRIEITARGDRYEKTLKALPARP